MCIYIYNVDDVFRYLLSTSKLGLSNSNRFQDLSLNLNETSNLVRKSQRRCSQEQAEKTKRALIALNSLPINPKVVFLNKLLGLRLQTLNS